ncbi:MAG: 8-oxo-dGTP diphosphatase [Thermofilum sp.]|nr:8-oxo-dGTP diphosphatase [Thermofilum sp.]MCC6065024.1 8-oxo-dGTP diphosphatase [Thermofilum sp.]
MTVKAVLCFLLRDGEVLLIRKKKGFGAGKINGVGGRVEPGERPEEAAVREVFEEVGVRVRSLEPAGTLEFYSADSEPDWLIHVFLSRDFEGEPRESEEASPRWYRLGELPFEEMWEDDRVWLRYALSGKRVEGRFWYDREYSRLLKWELLAR